MSEQDKQESQKTIVAFAAGLLIGGLLVWIFGGSPKQEEVKVTATTTPKSEVTNTEVTNVTNTEKETTTTAKPVMVTGEGKIVVGEVKAGSVVTLTSATFPTDEGWITVRESNNGQLSGLLGAARYSKEQGLTPSEVTLMRPMVTGKSYAVVFYSESGDKVFTQALDKQIDSVAPTIFTAK